MTFQNAHHKINPLEVQQPFLLYGRGYTDTHGAKMNDAAEGRVETNGFGAVCRPDEPFTASQFMLAKNSSMAIVRKNKNL